MSNDPASEQTIAPKEAAGEVNGAPTPSVRVTLLGTGTSTGVPVLGCDCRVCTSRDPRDKRMRSSCHVEVRSGEQSGFADEGAGDEGATSPTPTVHLQIDTGPDFRCQALRFGVGRVDAVLFTHAHFDHVVGLDDLRPFFFQNQTPVPCFARPHTTSVLRRMFPHIFVHDDYPNASKLTIREITSDALEGDAPLRIQSRYNAEVPPVHVVPVPLMHGELPTCGFRIGRFAYLTDASAIPEASFARLEGCVNTLVIDALHRKNHPTHFSIDEAVAAARRIGAQQTYFTHLTHSILHAKENPRLPDGIHLAYDGLRFTV